MNRDIHQEVVLAASPDRVYTALLDSRQHAQFTGARAEISGEAGGSISCHGGVITGRNLELVPNRRIVQAWRFKHWADGAYSIVRFELKPEGGQTRLVLDHAGFPEDQRAHLETGWAAKYWEPLAKFLAA